MKKMTNHGLQSVSPSKYRSKVMSSVVYVKSFHSGGDNQAAFRRRKFSHQMQLFSGGSAFLLHNNGVLAPLNLQTFENRVPEWNLLITSPLHSWQRGVPENVVTRWLTSRMRITFSVKQPCASRRATERQWGITESCLCFGLWRVY